MFLSLFGCAGDRSEPEAHISSGRDSADYQSYGYTLKVEEINNQGLQDIGIIVTTEEIFMKDLSKTEQYQKVYKEIQSLVAGESDLIALMSTIACHLHNHFTWFDWTGFYRVTTPGVLKVGPYQGGHGCLTIPFEKGVCGAAASQEKTQLVPNVHEVPYHIACASTTQSEIVVPVFNKDGQLIAVLDVDSNELNSFDETDQLWLEKICDLFKTVSS